MIFVNYIPSTIKAVLILTGVVIYMYIGNLYSVSLFFQMNSFDTIDSDDTSSYHNDGYTETYGHAWINGDLDGNCSDSDFPGTPSEMSSPLSQ